MSQQTGTSNTGPTFAKEMSFTRTGDFALNRDGYLQNSAGNVLYGYVQDPTQPAGKLDTSNLKAIHINQAGFAPIPTS